MLMRMDMGTGNDEMQLLLRFGLVFPLHSTSSRMEGYDVFMRSMKVDRQDIATFMG